MKKKNWKLLSICWTMGLILGLGIFTNYKSGIAFLEEFWRQWWIIATIYRLASLKRMDIIKFYSSVGRALQHKCRGQSNPVEVPLYIYFFFGRGGGGGGGRGLIFSCLNCNYNCNDHVFIQICIPHFTSTAWKLNFSLPISLIIYIDLARAKSKAPVNKFIIQIKQ